MNDSESIHDRAAEAFVETAREQHDDSIQKLIVFGSTARGDAQGVDSDVDIFVVLDDESVVEQLRDLAYDVTLDHGVVVSVHALTTDRFAERNEHPFVKQVLSKGRSYV